VEIEYSKHWSKKHLKKKKDITNDLIEYALKNSREMKDRNWESAFNAISRIPPSGRILKVVYRRMQHKVFIVTAYWLD
jgi:hypothetical protein